ncbi:uncharacterized protein PAC_05179 [Phialocephala subalpina]|uniref:Uncharacterized protein n=1 Tax=Phialocephala subalpina TaxID=576137 RepID=A0A1L7WR98_9HELO|nr:uncharacterized protein PAC_05179 [Phialocephala subalpina]
MAKLETDTQTKPLYFQINSKKRTRQKHNRKATGLTKVIPPRGLSLDNRINLIIGILTIIIAVLSTLLAWATWRLSHIHLRNRHLSHDEDTIIESTPLQELPAPHTTTSAHLLGYELAFRIGRNAAYDSMLLQELPAQPTITSARVLGYELAFRIGRSR